MTTHTLTHCHGKPFAGAYARDPRRLAWMWALAASAGPGVYTVEWETI